MRQMKFVLVNVEFYWILLTAENEVLKGFVDMEPYLIFSFLFFHHYVETAQEDLIKLYY
jgi:hypothetical protein